MLQNWFILLPELSILAYLLTSWQVNLHRKDKTPKTFFTLSKFFILVTLLATVVFYNKSAFPRLWVNDNYTTLFKTVIYLIALSWFYLSSKWFLIKNRSSCAFYNLAMTEVLLLELLVSSQNFGLTAVLLGGICITTWFLMRLYVDEDIISGLSKLYLFFAVIFSLFALEGALIIWLEVKSLYYPDILAHLQNAETISLNLSAAVALEVAALLFMMALAPFHSCFVSIVSLSILPVSGFVSLVPPLAYLACLLVLVVKVFAPLQEMLYWILGIFAALSVFIGAVSANGMPQLRRLFGYSTVYHFGFVMFTIIAFNQKSLLSSFAYMLVFLLAMFGIYSGFLGLKSRGEYLKTLDDINGASIGKPYISAAFLVFMFSLIGMPPMTGFLGLVSVANNLASTSSWEVLSALLLSLLLIANAYLQVIRHLYFMAPDGTFDRTDKSIYICLLLNMVLVVISLLNPGYLFKDAAKILTGGF